jgi:hypothetical protein
MIIAVFVEEFKYEIPQLGKVLSIQDGLIDLEWMTGCYSGYFFLNTFFCPFAWHCVGPWKTCKRRVGREAQAWTEKVPLSSVLYPIQLTKSNRLKSSIVDKLKSSYASLV